jgi:anti-sigma factor RsiW
MNQDTKLKLQAFVDNELSASEARGVAAWLERDPEAGALQAELRDISRVLKDNELQVKLPESREFYWSKIQRAIDQAAVEPKPRPVRYSVWMRLFGPALGLAVLLVAGLSLVKLNTPPTRLSSLHEIDMPLEETAAISFHSQSAGMTVVWVQSQGF